MDHKRLRLLTINIALVAVQAHVSGFDATPRDYYVLNVFERARVVVVILSAPRYHTYPTVRISLGPFRPVS